MEKKRIVPTWLSIVLIVLCITSICANVFNTVDLINNNVEYSLISLVDIILFTISSILALVYCIKGYKKDANKIFKLCSIVFTVALLLQVANKAIPGQAFMLDQAVASNIEAPVIQDADVSSTLNEYQNTIDIITSAISFGCMMVLSLAENLGKKKSLILSAAIIISLLVVYVSAIDFNRIGLFLINISFGSIINAIIYGIMVYAKYVDKEARGTK